MKPLFILLVHAFRADIAPAQGLLCCTHLRQLRARHTDGDDLRAAGIWMDGDDDFSMSNPMDDLPFRRRQTASRIRRLEAP